ncbi:MAG TPA: ATP-binding protein [Chitinophagaceae bacterium]|nr:ATP-binding protein [Chitinophagaceae bacterium]
MDRVKFGMLLMAWALLSVFRVAAQTPRIDSLKSRLAQAGKGAESLSVLLALCDQASSLSLDSLRLFASNAKAVASRYGNQHDIGLADFYLTLCLNREGLTDSALRVCNRKLAELTGTRDLYLRFKMLQIGLIAIVSRTNEALDSAYSLLKEAEMVRDTGLEIQLKSMIGSFFSDAGQYPEGLGWLYDADRTSLDPKYDSLKNNAVVFFNIGLDLNYLGKFDSAEVCAEKTISLARKFQNRNLLAYGLGLKAFILSYTGKPSLAEQPMKESLGIFFQMGSIYQVINAMTAMAKYYTAAGKPEKGIQICRNALALLAKYPIVPREIIYEQIAAGYKAAGNYRKYSETQEILLALKDSTYRVNATDAMTALQARYDISRNETLIASQKLQLLHKDLWIWGSVLLILLISAVVFFTFQRNRNRHKAALILAEEKERKRISADLHDNIGAYAAAISAGIDEIERRNLITDPEFVRNLKEYSTGIISSLRETIWAFNRESVTLVNLLDRIKIYIQKIQKAYPLIQIRMEENSPVPKILSPVQALNIIRIIQEGLHNALHHSMGTEVLVRLSTQEGFLELNIEDNGVGFDFEGIQPRGHGLNNMKKRAQEAGFRLSYSRMEPHGVRVRLVSAG